MANGDLPTSIYLDQNVFSRMQAGAVEREIVLDLLNSLRKKGAIFVYSMTHVDECRDSDNPEAFVDIIESISAHYIEQYAATDTKITVSPKRARELILAEVDIAEEAARLMEKLLMPMHFAAGWLDATDSKAIQEELLESILSFWKSLENQLPREMLDLLADGKGEMLRSIIDMPLQQIKEENLELGKRFRELLPKNYAQLDAVPADKVVEYMLSRLDENEQTGIRNSYPPQFWAAVNIRDEGALSGFAFMLFMMGLVRDPRVKKRDTQRRAKHFLGQFRDCQHIEAASRCAKFVTFDKGAARLAKAVYAYAGVATEVIHLEVLLA